MADAVQRGVAAFREGKAEDALRLAESALAVDVTNAHALLLAGMSCITLRRAEPAIAFLEEAVRQDESLVDAHLNLGAAYRLADRLGEATAACRRALALDPDHADAHANLGMVLRDAGEFAAAEIEFRAALARRPGDHRLIHHLAHAVAWLGRVDEASLLDDRAVALAPHNAEYRFHRGDRRLWQGRFAQGWRDLECRWDYAKSGSVRRNHPHAPWRGENVGGKKIVVWGEQGVGDHLLHAHQMRHLTDAGAQVIFETDPRLVALLGRSLPGIATIAAADPPAPEALARDVEYQVPLATLPLYLPDWPARYFPLERWLVPDASRRAALARRIDKVAAGRRTVGIAWRSKRANYGLDKSMALDSWAPVLGREDTLFVTLQYGDVEAEVAAARAATGADIYTDPEIDRFDDLEGLVALIDTLDAIVTTSNVTVHFAGALGKPTMLALHHMPLWYWYPAFDAYRSVERFRQETAGDWAPVVARIAGRLGELSR